MLARLKPQIRNITDSKPVQPLKKLPIQQVNKWLLPRDRYGQRLLYGALGFMTFLYAIAQADQGISFFLLMGPLLPVFILAIVGGFICLILSIGYCFQRPGHPAPLMVMLLGLYFIFQSSAPLSPEHSYFQKHQAKYEEVVELVGQEKLTHNDRCQDPLFAVPSEYQYLTGNCLTVNSQPSGLAIEFTGLSLDKPVVYAPSREAVKSVKACHQEGTIYKQMDKDWYICDRS
jgi:hypothetical protein